MKWRRILSAILVFSVVFSLFPQIGFAEGEEDTIYYSPVELWSTFDVHDDPLGTIDPNSSSLKVFNAQDNAGVYPEYQSFISNATGELKKLSYRSYLSLKGYDLRK